MSVKGIKFTDVFKEQMEEVDAETKEAQMDADFSIMTAEFTTLLKELFDMFTVITIIKNI